MGISLNSVANGVKNVTSATLATGQPNWSYIPSAAKQTKTQTEFITEIKELARNAATVTNKANKDSIDRQLLQLRAEYLSDVSPDRKSLYQSAKNAIQKSSNTNPKCRGIGELSLLDFLEQADGRGNLAEKQFALAGGGTLTCPILSTGGYGAVIECQGAKVLMNTGNGWSYEMTPAELAKKNEFYKIYWNEYRTVKGNNELSELPDYLEERSIFNRKA